MTGTTLGGYRVLDKLGAGGMGEVYRATDTRLKRDVAIKVLPVSMAGDPERLARFQREAEVLAALNHPHIAAIYGFEDLDAGPGKPPVRALVMELVEGPTLADRIGQGALPLDDALAIARQIADALEAAHERGIVHRDLKPANIKVRPDGTVKVLDFGLAKALMSGTVSNLSGDEANSPTITSPAMTQIGMILGTAAYMAPEQARGRTADKRADIWAFGCVLFEMLTGQRAFPGDDVTDTLAAVVKLDPNWSALGRNVPPHVAHALRVCLQKDPRRRGGDIAAIRLALEGVFEREPAGGASAAAPARRWVWPLAAAAIALGGVLVGLVAWLERPATEPRRVVRFAISELAGKPVPVSPGQVLSLALSPDGTKLVYRVPSEGSTSMLVLRDIGALEATTIYQGPLASPFFSPDGNWVGFFAPEGQKNAIKKVAVTGGPAVTIASIPEMAAPHGATWGDNGTIVFGMHDRGLWRAAGDGGSVEPLIPAPAQPDGKAPPPDYREWPSFLPGGQALLYSERPGGGEGGDASRIVVRNMASGEERVLVSGGSFPQYLPTGHLVYAFDGTLRIVGFDLDRLAVVGTPRPVLEGVVTKDEGGAEFHVARDGSLVYLTGSPGVRRASLVWRDRAGRETPFGSGTLDQPQHPRLSPDGQRLAVSVARDLWVYFVDGRPPIRLSSGGNYIAPLWSPDGKRVIAEGANGLVSLAADGSEPAPVQVSMEGHFHPHGWSSDGRDLLAVKVDIDADIVRWPLASPKEVTPVVATPSVVEGPLGASLSPDGRWLAYVSNQTGTPELWVRPYPGPGSPIRVSPDGARDPVWARSGRELYYFSGSRLMAVSVAGGSTPSFGTPAMLFEATPFRIENQPPSFDVSADGRFVMLKGSDEGQSAEATRLIVVQNWSQELFPPVR
jgi:serine/threonine-protein kinase